MCRLGWGGKEPRWERCKEYQEPSGRLSCQATSLHQPSLPSLATEPFPWGTGRGVGEGRRASPAGQAGGTHTVTQQVSAGMKLTAASGDQTAPLCAQHLAKGAAETRPVPRGACATHPGALSLLPRCLTRGTSMQQGYPSVQQTYGAELLPLTL